MRVIPNLYPAFDGDEPFAVHHLGPVHVEAEASGIHEVFVLHPRARRWASTTLSDADAAEMMLVLKRRFLEHAATANVRYTQAIINHGREAGASLAHPHGQLLGLPFVPGEMLEEQRAFSRFEGGCILCATIEAELVDGERVAVRQRRRRVRLPVLERLAVRAADHPAQPRAAPHRRQRRHAGRRSAWRSATAIELLRETHGDIAYNIGVPHRAAPLQRCVPLARAPVAEAGHHGRLRARHRRDDQHRAARGGRRAAAPPVRQSLIRPTSCRGSAWPSRSRRRPQQVWEVVEPIEHHVEWMHDAVAIRFQSDQHRGVGTRFLCDTKVGPIKLVDRMEITEWVPGDRRWACATRAWSPAPAGSR